MTDEKRYTIGMTGSRYGIDKRALNRFEQFLQKEFHLIEKCRHGDCQGADTIFHNKIIEFNSSDKYENQAKIIIHPPNIPILRSYCGFKEDKVTPIDDPNIKSLRVRPFLDRNKHIVDKSDMLLAFPRMMEEELRSGTWSTIRYARKKNKALKIFYPDGTTSTI